MFRTQANPMDDAIVKATDENLTSENWEYILDVCDRASNSASGPQQAVAALIKRLAHRNANVQLYTLELANALSQNCGASLHRELASKAFTDALLRLVADRNTHGQVKQKVMERMGSWVEEFGRSPDFGIMEQAFGSLRRQQPGLMPPSKPVKREISTEDRRKEEDELQMALALSIKDKGASPQPNGTGRDDSVQQPAQSHSDASSPPQQQHGTTAATVSRVRALYDFTPSEPGELAFRKNDIIAVLESVYKDWWKGSLRGETGIFPLNYVEKLQDPTREELERDAQMEAEVFGETKNVERLLALLSVRDGSSGRRNDKEEQEISELYERTVTIRPKLVQLIGNYSQKKDDFTQLNEKFIKARRDYEALLESSMSQPQYQQQYPIRGPRQSQVYPQQPYGAPGPQAQGYPPQGPQGYPPQQPYPQQQRQDPQRYYTPAPSEQPPPQQQQQQQPGIGYPPGPMSPPSQHSAGPGPDPAPFHFIPGGFQAQGAPPPLQGQQPPQQGQQPPQPIQRKPSPQVANMPTSPNRPSDPYNQAGNFQGQIRPNSIHTLNSGNPQELATGGYESPVDNRHSYPPAQQQQHMGMPPPQQQQAYDGGYAPVDHQQQQQQPQHPLMPQRTHSFESPTSAYSHGTDSAVGYAPPQQQQQTYQAYQPYQQQQQSQQRLPSGGGGPPGSVGDPGEFYR